MKVYGTGKMTQQPTADQIRQKLAEYATENGLRMAMIGRGLHDCPIKNLCGRTFYEAFRKGGKVSHGTLAIIAQFLNQQPKENGI